LLWYAPEEDLAGPCEEEEQNSISAIQGRLRD
jgi:hypothetical protein